jgi:hypothetical protein
VAVLRLSAQAGLQTRNAKVVCAPVQVSNRLPLLMPTSLQTTPGDSSWYVSSAESATSVYGTFLEQNWERASPLGSAHWLAPGVGVISHTQNKACCTVVGVAVSVGSGTSVNVSDGTAKVAVGVLAGANSAQALHRRMNRKPMDKCREKDNRTVRSPVLLL